VESQSGVPAEGPPMLDVNPSSFLGPSLPKSAFAAQPEEPSAEDSQ